MSRPAPRITPREIVAGVKLDPNGAHELEISVPGNIVGMRFGRDHVDQLEKVLARYRALVAVEDGSTVERHNPRFVAIEVR
jgi:hypothetical protein